MAFNYFIYLIILAGTPPTTVLGATFLVITEFAETILFSPIVTPVKIATPSPIHTLFSIITGPFEYNSLFRGGFNKSCFEISPWL